MNLDSKLYSKNISAAAAWMASLFFCLTIILLPFRFRYILLERPAPPIYKDFTDFLLFGSDVTLLILLAFWGLSQAFAPRPVRLGPKFLWLPLAGLIFTSLFTSFTSLDVELSLYHTLRLAVLFLFYLYAVNEARSQELVVLAVAVQAIIQSLIALAQFFLQRSIGLKSFGEHELDPAVGGVSIVSTGATRVLRSYGLTEHPNILGGCLALGLIIFLAAYLYGRSNTRQGIALVMMLSIPALFVTFSRSAWLAFFGGAILLFGAVVHARDRNKLRAFLWLAITCALAVAPLVWKYSNYVGERFNVGNSFIKNPYENRSIFERLLLDEMGIQIFLDKPLTGIGLGASALGIHQYFPDFIGSFVPPHFVLLAVAMELGFAGLACYLCLTFLPWIVLVRKKFKLRVRPTLLAASVLMIALTLIGFLDIYPWLLPPGRLWQWLIWGLWARAYELEGANHGSGPTQG